jgi:hypothetical protein
MRCACNSLARRRFSISFLSLDRSEVGMGAVDLDDVTGVEDLGSEDDELDDEAGGRDADGRAGA